MPPNIGGGHKNIVCFQIRVENLNNVERIVPLTKNLIEGQTKKKDFYITHYDLMTFFLFSHFYELDHCIQLRNYNKIIVLYRLYINKIDASGQLLQIINLF